MIIFIAGIHGVGKSYLCHDYSVKNKILHKSASELIKEEKNATWGTNKYTKNIEDNQSVLIDAISKIKESLLLDGHLVLLNEDREFEEIDIDFFKQINPELIILIENNEEVIRTRLRTRDNNYDDIDLKKFLELERKQARLISEALKKELVILNAPSLDDFSKVIDSYIEKLR